MPSYILLVEGLTTIALTQNYIKNVFALQKLYQTIYQTTYGFSKRAACRGALVVLCIYLPEVRIRLDSALFLLLSECVP